MIFPDENISPPADAEFLHAQPVGLAKSAGMGLMRGAADIAGALTLAVGGLQGLALNEEDREKTFKFYDEYIKPAKEYWTVDPAANSFAGKLLHGVSSLGVPLALGPAAVPTLIGSTTLNTGAELVDQGVDGTTATAVGIGMGMLTGAQIRLPASGKHIGQTLGLIALNPVMGAGMTQAQKSVLEGQGYFKQAAGLDPLDPVGRSVDLFLGAVFGGMHHYAMARKVMPTEVGDAIDTVAQHNKGVNSTPFEPTARAANAHLSAQGKAIDDLMAGKPVDVQTSLNDLRPLLPEKFGVIEFRHSMQDAFGLADDQITAIEALITARAKMAGEPVDQYVQQRMAGVLKGEKPVEGALKQDIIEPVKPQEGTGNIPPKKTPEPEVGQTIRFIRYGEPTPNSRDYSTGTLLEGMSVYSLDLKGAAQQVIRSEFADRKKVYIGTGEVVGFGTDGEPLVVNFKLRKATTLEDEKAYYGGISRAKWRKQHGYDEKGNKISDSSSPAGEAGQLFQSATGTAKGAISFLEDGRAVIHAFKSADVTTALHELGHLFRRDLAGDDLRIAQEWAGAKDGQWNVQAEETFARGFERYLQEGKAPTPEMGGIFEKFKQWITDVYRHIRGYGLSDVKMAPDIRSVFDRLFAPQDLPLRAEATPDAKGFATEAITELQAEHERIAGLEPPPVERTVIEDWGTSTTVFISKRGEFMRRLSRERKPSGEQPKQADRQVSASAEAQTTELRKLEFMRDRLAATEGPAKITDETGEIVRRSKSGHPEWFQNRGIDQAEGLRILDKAIEGKPLTEKQQAVFDDMAESAEREWSRARRLLDDPIEEHIEGILEEKGDVPGGNFTGLDEQGRPQYTGARKAIDDARAEVMKAEELEPVYKRIANCIAVGG